MKRLNQSEFYDLGRKLKALADVTGPVHPTRFFMEFMHARQALLDLHADKPIQLGLSKGPANYLLSILNTIYDRVFVEDDKITFKWPDDDAPAIQEYELAWYRQHLTSFETVFFEEMREASTYIVPPRGLYNIPALVDHADKSIPDDVSAFIPDRAKTDWRAAGRCLAFDLPSATGFHVARAIESTIEAYYKAYIGHDPSEGRSWGDLIADLDRVAQNPVPQPKTLALLRQIKDDWRNPVVHPRITLVSTDAEVLFALGASVLIAVAQELKTVSASGIQPSLTLFSSDTSK